MGDIADRDENNRNHHLERAMEEIDQIAATAFTDPVDGTEQGSDLIADQRSAFVASIVSGGLVRPIVLGEDGGLLIGEKDGSEGIRAAGFIAVLNPEIDAALVYLVDGTASILYPNEGMLNAFQSLCFPRREPLCIPVESVADMIEALTDGETYPAIDGKRVMTSLTRRHAKEIQDALSQLARLEEIVDDLDSHVDEVDLSIRETLGRLALSAESDEEDSDE